MIPEINFDESTLFTPEQVYQVLLESQPIGSGFTARVYRIKYQAIKVYPNMPHEYVKKEATAQQFASLSGLNVPKVYSLQRLDQGQIVLGMDLIEGHLLFERRMEASARKEALSKMVDLMVQMHSIRVTSGAVEPQLDLQIDRMNRRLQNNPHLSDPQKQLLFERLLQLTNDQNTTLDDLRLCHGDFHPHNIIEAPSTNCQADGAQNKYWIIDWIDATMGYPAADACRTYLIFTQYIKRSAQMFLRLYCDKAAKAKIPGTASDQVLAWMPIMAAIRMSEGIDTNERQRLASYIDLLGQ